MKLTINFKLKSGKEKTRPLLAILSFGYKEYDLIKEEWEYKPVSYYTTVKYRTDEWDCKNKRPYSEIKYGELLQLAKKIEDVFNYLSLDNDVIQSGGITPIILKNTLDEKLKGKSSAKNVSKVRLVDFIDKEILASDEFKPDTKANYTTLKNKLIAFEKSIGKELYTNDLNVEMYALLKAHGTKKMKKNNAVWTFQKDFVSTLNKIREKYKMTVFNPSTEVPSKAITKLNEPDAVYFTYEQVKAIIKHKPESELLKNVKLILLTLIFTGCRESDVFKIKPSEIYSKKGDTFRYARILTKKGGVEMIVPILKPLEDAIEENGGQPATKMSRTDFNREVKNLVKDCGLTDEVTNTFINKKGVKEFQVKKFYDFVSSHTGRRSFITNLINFIPLPVLSKMTGHTTKDKGVIFGYNKISLIDNAVLFRKLLKTMTKDYPDHFVIRLI